MQSCVSVREGGGDYYGMPAPPDLFVCEDVSLLVSDAGGKETGEGVSDVFGGLDF